MGKIHITTVYSNVDKDFLNFWLNQLPVEEDIKSKIEDEKEIALQSKDPTSSVIGETTWKYTSSNTHHLIQNKVIGVSDE